MMSSAGDLLFHPLQAIGRTWGPGRAAMPIATSAASPVSGRPRCARSQSRARLRVICRSRAGKLVALRSWCSCCQPFTKAPGRCPRWPGGRGDGQGDGGDRVSGRPARCGRRHAGNRWRRRAVRVPGSGRSMRPNVVMAAALLLGLCPMTEPRAQCDRLSVLTKRDGGD